jgi:hypothetical protein
VTSIRSSLRSSHSIRTLYISSFPHWSYHLIHAMWIGCEDSRETVKGLVSVIASDPILHPIDITLLLISTFKSWLSVGWLKRRQAGHIGFIPFSRVCSLWRYSLWLIFGWFRKGQESGRNAWDRVLGFLEQPLFLVVVSTIGGIVGVLAYAPIFMVCVLCIPLALHRSKAVADKSRLVQLTWYCLTVLVG